MSRAAGETPRLPAPRIPPTRARSCRASRADRWTRSSRLFREIGEIKIDRERHKASKAQAAPDAPPPQLDLVDGTVLRHGILHGILGGEMIARAPRGTRQRRGRKG